MYIKGTLKLYNVLCHSEGSFLKHEKITPKDILRILVEDYKFLIESLCYKLGFWGLKDVGIYQAGVSDQKTELVTLWPWFSRTPAGGVDGQVKKNEVKLS